MIDLSGVKVIKRDGSHQNYDATKIESAISKASEELSSIQCHTYATYVNDNLYYSAIFVDPNQDKFINIEDIQDEVERVLMKYQPEVAKKYILYRNNRTRVRESKSSMNKAMSAILNTDSKNNNTKRENANINGDTAMGTMLRIGSEVSKMYYIDQMLDKDEAQAHSSGDIHIHDLDFYRLTETCCQIDIEKLFKEGFCTGHGYLREPKHIMSAVMQTCIAIQSNQNDQHGGQSIPSLDYGLAKYVAIEYINQIDEVLRIKGFSPIIRRTIKSELESLMSDNNRLLDKEDSVRSIIDDSVSGVDEIISLAKSGLEVQVRQAMEALVYNLNTLHSRAGAQVPFSSINYGTDTSEEGRLIIKYVLLATEEGLGDGETPIFPIHIFKIKEGVNFNVGDPNYDLYQLSLRVTAKRLFPNYSFIDAPFNLKYYKEGHPETEVAYMGCRTRVMGNVYDPSREITYGRGNLSFTSINLPRLGIECKGDWNKFYERLTQLMELSFKQLYNRYLVQSRNKVYNHPFLMGQGIWIDSDKLNYDDEVGTVLKHGSLTVGFVGLAECLVAMTGSHHGESEKSQKLGLQIISYMRNMCDQKSQDTKMNYALMATPAESLSGRFLRLDRERYGVIPGVTDREYYTNSFHVPVYYPISVTDKIDIEAPYHDLTNGGHISYVEVSGDPSNNLEALDSIIRYAQSKGIGYFSINHPVDTDPVCGYTGIIGDTCPRCGRKMNEGIPLEKLLELKKKYPRIRIPTSITSSSCCDK